MLGAGVSTGRKYYSALITEATALRAGDQSRLTDWSVGWLYYYLTRPLFGAVLGAMSYLLSFIGVQVLTFGDRIEMSEEGRLLLYALAFLSGFAVSHVLDRLEAVSKEIFRPYHKP
jgi:hypothetical protein